MFPEKIKKEREVVMLNPSYYELLNRVRKEKKLTKGDIVEHCLSEVLIKGEGYSLK